MRLIGNALRRQEKRAPEVALAADVAPDRSLRQCSPVVGRGEAASDHLMGRAGAVADPCRPSARMNLTPLPADPIREQSPAPCQGEPMRGSLSRSRRTRETGTCVGSRAVFMRGFL